MSFSWKLRHSLLLFGACAGHVFGATPPQADTQPVGSELVLCEHCPPFVRVPDAPTPLRPIRYVAEFELTWNNYLAAVDDGSCTVPNPDRPPIRRTKPDDINPNLKWFRIDWPITILGPLEVDCYVAWLQKQTDMTVALPTAAEWQWFASAGNDDFKYPWGSTPGGGKEVLKGYLSSDLQTTPWPGNAAGRYVNKYLTAFKVGQFPSNSWGLHDLMGNAIELTADVEDRPARTTDQSSAVAPDKRVVLVGSSHSDPNWAEAGLSARHYSIIWGDQYSAYASVRLILTQKATGT